MDHSEQINPEAYRRQQGMQMATDAVLFRLLDVLASKGLLSYEDLQLMFSTTHPQESGAEAQGTFSLHPLIASGRDEQMKLYQEVLLPRLLQHLPKAGSTSKKDA